MFKAPLKPMIKAFKTGAAAPIIGAILATIIYYGLSWIATCGVVKLITLCFGMIFSWPLATGIWLLLMLVDLIF